ncbi:MAG: hypothetical protein JNL10_14385 [Verrucomicrobiales bacterium]|nr:hypothetical protein [Verrucomicrobiales bacterium]
MSNLINKIASALDRALSDGQHQSILESDADAAARREKDRASTPKPGAMAKAEREVEAAMQKLAAAAEQRERLLDLGRQYRRMTANLERLEARLRAGLESIATIEAQAAQAWEYAGESFGDPRSPETSGGNASNAVAFEACAEGMRQHLVPRLEAEVAAARKAVTDFAKKHDMAEIETAEAEAVA